LAGFAAEIVLPVQRRQHSTSNEEHARRLTLEVRVFMVAIVRGILALIATHLERRLKGRTSISGAVI